MVVNTDCDWNLSVVNTDCDWNLSGSSMPAPVARSFLASNKGVVVSRKFWALDTATPAVQFALVGSTWRFW